MRVITEKMLNAFKNGKTFNGANTSVEGGQIRLHGNLIAEMRKDGFWITNAGWQSNTTKERLNALPNVSITQKNWVWYLNGKEWDGKWVNVANW